MLSFYLNQTYNKKWNYLMYIWPSCLEMIGIPCHVRWGTRLTFPISLTFSIKDFSELRDTWTICDLTKLNNEKINAIYYHSNYFTGGRWPYSCCFLGCCFEDLFCSSILVQFLSSFFSICLASVHVVHPYSRIDTIAAWKKLSFILSDRFDFHVIDNLSIASHAFAIDIIFSRWDSASEVGEFVH